MGIRDFLNRKDFPLILILIHAAIRIFIAYNTDLGNDEVYYVNYALYPAWSYFDHPPMIGWFIWLSTFGLKFVSSAFFVRFISIITGVINLSLIFLITKKIADRQSGIIALLLASCSFYVGIISGTFILPDTPLTIFWLCALYLFVVYLKSESNRTSHLLLFGLFCGLALICKYQAIFLWGGALGFILFHDRKTLKQPSLYIAGIISITLFIPVIWWNIKSSESGLQYHAGRVGSGSLLPNFKNFPQEFFGQFFYNNPVNVILIIWGTITSIKQNRKLTPEIKFLYWCGFPLIITTLVMSTYNKTLPHWSGPSYFALIIASSVFLTQLNNKNLFKWLVSGQALYLLVLILAIVQINFGILIPQFKNQKTGKNDFSTDLSIWDETGEMLNQKLDIKKPVITHNWFPASHLNFYYTLNNSTPLFVVGKPNQLHEYQRINTLQKQLNKGKSAYYLTTSHHYKAPSAFLTEQFSSISDSTVLQVYKHNKKRMIVYIWELENLKDSLNKIEH